MGANNSNDLSNPRRQLKLNSLSSQQFPQYQQQFSQIRNCCGLKIKSQNKKRSQLLWEKKAIYFCQKYKKYAQWANDVIKVIKSCSKSSQNIPKMKRFKRQFNDVKYLQTQTRQRQKQMSLTANEILNFRSNLKNSVLLNQSQIKRLHNQMISNINSSLEIQDKQKISSMSLSKSQVYLQQLISSKGQIQKPKVNPSKNILRQSVINLVDDTITSIFKGQQKLICKLSAHSLQVFVKFTIMLQKHLTNPQHQVYQIIECFQNKLYLSQQKAKIKKITEQNQADISALQMESLIHSIKIFIALLVEIVQDYYSIRVLDNRQEDVSYLICSYQNLLTIVTAILFKNQKFYNFLFSHVMLFNRQIQDEFSQKFNQLHGKPTQFFSIKKYYSMNSAKVKKYNENLSSLQSRTSYFGVQQSQNEQKQKPYVKCSEALYKLAKTRTPIAKMKAILQCAQKISQSISQFYTQNKMNLKKNMIDADQILSIFCYILSTKKIDYINSHMFIIDQFATDQQKMSMAGYYFSVISCAITHFMKINSKPRKNTILEEQEHIDESKVEETQIKNSQQGLQRIRQESAITFNKASLLTDMKQ